MLFQINTILYDNVRQQYVEGLVVIDLYVGTEEEANANLFARDVMNLPVIKAGIHEYLKQYKLDDCKWTLHSTATYSYQHEVKCVYQENDDHNYKCIKKFAINMLFETDSDQCPIGTQYLTCNSFYDAYEIAWHRHYLGKAPSAAYHCPTHMDDLYVIVTNTKVDVACILNDNPLHLTAKVNDDPSHIVQPQSMSIQSSFHPIPLFDDLLLSQLGFACDKKEARGKSAIEFLVLKLVIDGTYTTVCLEKDSTGYACTTDNSLLTAGVIHIAYLSELQGILRHQLPVNQENLYNYLNQILRQYLIVTTLYYRHCELALQYPKISRDEEIKLHAQHFGVMPPVIEAEMARQYL